MHRRKLCPIAYMRTGMFAFVAVAAVIGAIAGAAFA
jgi:hypothetical protein